MEEELESLNNNETWDLVVLPNGRKLIDSKWEFKKKLNAVFQVKKYKDWLVTKWYSQIEGIDFGEISSHVAKLTFVRVLMSLATTFGLEIEHMDVKTTFFHGDLEEDIYMKNPKGFTVKGEKELVWKLNKYIHGLIQSPIMWY